MYAYNILLRCNITLLKLLQVDDLQKDTDDVPHSNVPVVIAPHNNDQTSDGVNQNTNNPTVSYITTQCWNHVMYGYV